MKKAKIILILSILIFVALLVIYIVGQRSEHESNRPVSMREQYQSELQQKGDQNE